MGHPVLGQALEKTVVLRTMPTSQNRDRGHPVLWQARKTVVLRTMPVEADPNGKAAGDPG
jgi:hypothetical protein